MEFIYFKRYNTSQRFVNMVPAMLIRLINIRNVINVSNISVVAGTLHGRQYSDTASRPPTSIDIELSKLVDSDEPLKKQRKISKSMRIYLQRSKEYQKFIAKETIKYEVGKRHLANMMGVDPEQFSEKDITTAIKYLFPSGLYDRKARPLMLSPLKVFGQSKEAEFNEEGKPFHFLYYTCKKNYYEILYNIAQNMKSLNEKEEAMWAKKKLPTPENRIDLVGSDWRTKVDLENMIHEELETNDYNYLIKSLERVADHPMSKCEIDFIMKFRKPLDTLINKSNLPKLQYDKNDRPYVITFTRKQMEHNSAN